MATIVSIGLVGGVASGKSLVAKTLVELGAVHLDADRTGHEVLADDAEVHRLLVGRWGDSIVAADGRIDRAAIARHVFGGSESAAADRAFLESVLHPRIGARLKQRAEEAAISGKPAVVLDAPLLLEAGWKPLCDVILMIDSPRELRRKRAATRGWSEAEFDLREAAQWPVDKKRQSADAVISNTGTADELHRAVADFWAKHVAPTTHKP
jgi:dephospho-CoA kinase